MIPFVLEAQNTQNAKCHLSYAHFHNIQPKVNETTQVKQAFNLGSSRSKSNIVVTRKSFKTYSRNEMN